MFNPTDYIIPLLAFFAIVLIFQGIKETRKKEVKYTEEYDTELTQSINAKREELEQLQIKVDKIKLDNIGSTTNVQNFLKWMLQNNIITFNQFNDLFQKALPFTKK